MKNLDVWIPSLVMISLLGIRSATASECGSDRAIVGSAVLAGPTITFRLSNASSSNIEVVRGFSHEQKMLLVIALKDEIGNVVPRLGEFGGDPPVGTYDLAPNQSIEESYDLSSRWPGVLKKSGKAIIFWSTDARVLNKDSSCTVRVSGSLEVNLPVSKAVPPGRETGRSWRRDVRLFHVASL